MCCVSNQWHCNKYFEPYIFTGTLTICVLVWQYHCLKAAFAAPGSVWVFTTTATAVNYNLQIIVFFKGDILDLLMVNNQGIAPFSFVIWMYTTTLYPVSVASTKCCDCLEMIVQINGFNYLFTEKNPEVLRDQKSTFLLFEPSSDGISTS